MTENHSASRVLFLKWLLLQAATVLFFAGFAAQYGGRVHGSSLVAIPAILIVFAWATALGGRACWWAETRPEEALHLARYLNFWGWVCQLLGIMGTILGFWIMLSDERTLASDLAGRIREGGGVALMATFVGVACSLVLGYQERMIDHAIGRGRGCGQDR